MSLGRSILRFLGSLLRLAVFALVVGLVVAVVLPGGPLDLDALDRPSDAPEWGDTPDDPDGGSDGATTPRERPRGESPWGKEVLTVAVRNRADPSRNVTGAVAEALAYWERNVGYADYPVEFELRPDAAAADVVVWYNESIECANHADAIGCAPLVEAGTRVDPPVDVQVRYDPTDNRRQVRNTAIHELGHVLGITHCEEPHWVMSSACREPIPDAPNADQRDLAWRDDTISVYVDYGNVSGRELEASRVQVGHAMAYFEDGRAEDFPGNVSFVRAEDRFAADLTIAFQDDLACRQGAVVCDRHRGRDFDGDGRIEYHTGGTIYVGADSDVDARGWYVGWGLSRLLAPGHVPPVFEDASYRERRSDWWE